MVTMSNLSVRSRGGVVFGVRQAWRNMDVSTRIAAVALTVVLSPVIVLGLAIASAVAFFTFTA